MDEPTWHGSCTASVSCSLIYMRSCDNPSCENRHYGRGMCSRHYQRWRAGTYDPETGLDTTTFYAKTPEERLDKYVPYRGEGCWPWAGSINIDTGYGQCTSVNGMTAAHRWVYEQLVGPVPAGMHLDHLCRNRWCVRPGHLEPVSNKENAHRGLGGPLGSALRTECSRGHDVTNPDNVYVSPKGKRMCRPCIRIRKRTSRSV